LTIPLIGFIFNRRYITYLFLITHGIGAERAKEKLLRELLRSPKSLKMEVMGKPLSQPHNPKLKKS
jgi:hypothetical protein